MERGSAEVLVKASVSPAQASGNDYQDTLMAAAGHQAEETRAQAMKENDGQYLVIVDGAIPTVG